MLTPGVWADFKQQCQNSAARYPPNIDYVYGVYDRTRLQESLIMVEGPGCKVKGENLNPKIQGQTVKNVDGNRCTMMKVNILRAMQMPAKSSDKLV